MKTKSKSKDSITDSTSDITRETTTQTSVSIEVTLAQSFERRINKLEQRVERLELEKKKRKVQQYYAVVVGRVPGVYQSWPEANAQVDRFPGQVHRGKFKSSEDANQWFDRERTRYEKCIHTNARYLPDYRPTT